MTKGCGCTPAERYGDAQGNYDLAFERGQWEAARYTHKLNQWVDDFYTAQRRVCWKCGDADGRSQPGGSREAAVVGYLDLE